MKRKQSLITPAALAFVPLLFLAHTLPTNSATTATFTDESAFLANLSSFTTHNFDSFSTDTSNPLVLNQQIPGIDFDNAVVYPGCCGGTFKSGPNVVLNQDFATPIVFFFNTPVLAVGLFNTSLVDAERFEVFDAQNNLLASINLPNAVVNFGGFISDMGIAKGIVTPIAPTNGSIYIDDLTVASFALIPEPSTFILLLAGIFGVSAHRYWRRKKVA
jgi:hypothetical protein